MICLVLLAIVATWGVFTRHIDDTIGQRVGLSVVAISCIARIVQRLMYGYPAPAPETLVILVGVTVYAVSTAAKIVCASRAADRTHRRGAAHGC